MSATTGKSSYPAFLTGCAFTLMILMFLGVQPARVAEADAVKAGSWTLISAGSTLFCVDAGNQYLTAYRADGNSLRLIGGRSMEHDAPHKELSWFEKKEKPLTPEVMKDMADRARKERERMEKKRKK